MDSVDPKKKKKEVQWTEFHTESMAMSSFLSFVPLYLFNYFSMVYLVNDTDGFCTSLVSGFFQLTNSFTFQDVF